MQKFPILLAALALACNSSQKSVGEYTALPSKQPADAAIFASTITQSELKEHLYTYASDEFQGRETGTEGQKKAVHYLRQAYEDLGIEPAPGTDKYFQKVPLELARLPEGTLTLNQKTYANGADFMTFRAGEGTYSEIVYVGYGIDDPAHSDYGDRDVRGKWLLMKAGEPKNEDGSYVLSGTGEPSAWSNQSEAIGKRLEAAQARGAAGFFYVDDLNYMRYERYFNNMKRNNSGQMGLKSDETEPQLVLLRSGMAREIYPGIEANDQAEVIPAELRVAVQSQNEEIDTENVVALIRGTEFPDQYVVISSHLDHIGVTPTGEINNGADDDGSGTVALLEIAEAFEQAARDGAGPRRSVVFLHVTGEEKGLLGSQYYTDMEPLLPLASTVANLNIDMIGRTDPNRSGDRNYIYLIGSDKLSTELHELSEQVNARFTQLDLDYKYNDENDPNRFYYRSDHYNFAKNNIPIIFYFNGTHADYHRPGDTPDKIEYDLLEKRTRLVFYTAWEVANRDGRIVADKAAK